MKRLVVKIGSGVLSDPESGVRTDRIDDIARQIAAITMRDIDVVVVSSGAIACGWPRLRLQERPHTLPMLQACAAAGQSLLMRSWEDALAPHRLTCAQVLLTHGDVADRRRFLNARETLLTLIGRSVVPVVNENDTVSVDEIRFGDNDNLSADVAVLVSADVLLILTEVAGLMTGDPHIDDEATLIPEVRDIDAEAVPVAGPGTGRYGTGGMISKVEAARKATSSGVQVVVASGLQVDTILRVVDGEDVGTRFVPSEDRLQARKHWIAYTLKPKGCVRVDEGARKALVDGGKSLLASGIREVEGDFRRGEAVTLEVAADGTDPFAQGLAAYSAQELRQIAGRKSSEIESTLGYSFGDEVIHRDDLVVF